MSTAANRAIVRRFLEEVLTQRSMTAADALIAPDAVLHMSLGRFTGRRGIQQLGFRLSAAFPDRRITVDDLTANGNWVVTRWTLRGTQRGEFLGVPPKGKPTTLRGVGLFRLEDGKIIESWLGDF